MGLFGKKKSDQEMKEACNRAQALINEKRYAQAVPWLEKASELGNLSTRYNLGVFYYNGMGVEEDYDKAYELIRKAADGGYDPAVKALPEVQKKYELLHKRDAQGWFDAGCYHGDENGSDYHPAKALMGYEYAARLGHVGGAHMAGLMYYEGEGCEKNRDRAYYWQEKAAKAGDAEAICTLGLWARAAHDRGEAVKWYGKLADQGDIKAMNICGEICCASNDLYEDHGQDLAAGFRWYMKAAQAGDSNAMLQCGKMYERGWGVTRNENQARAWYEEAKNKGNHKASLALFMLK